MGPYTIPNAAMNAAAAVTARPWIFNLFTAFRFRSSKLSFLVDPSYIKLISAERCALSFIVGDYFNLLNH